MTRAELVESAAGINGNYRSDTEDRELEVGFLYGTAELVTALTLAENESYSAVREQVAQQIDREAARDSYPILPANGWKSK